MKTTEFWVILGLLIVVVFLAVRHDYVPVRSVGRANTRPSQSSSNVETERLQAVYASSKPRRLKLFKDLFKGRTSSSWQFGNLYNGLVPEVFCPSLVRVGAVSDGGKWICKPWAMPENCAIYSLGVNEDTSFERELQDLTKKRCKVYAYDKRKPHGDRVLAGAVELNIFFKQALIGTENNADKNMVSLKTELQQHKDPRVEILKIDIEGTEFSVLPQLTDDVPMCQILVEIHGTAQQNVQLLNNLGKKGYRLFSYEINGKAHHLCEYSLIHDDCLVQYDAVPLSFYLAEASD